MPKKPSPATFVKNIPHQHPGALPPLHLWQPELTGEMDIRIAQDGTWFHEGRPIRRQALVRLFSRILRKEDDGQFYLVSPTEKYRIHVEDAPFVALQMDVRHLNNRCELDFFTSMEDKITANKEHPIWVVTQDHQPKPYIRVRDRLDALISRNLFYQLVEIGEERVVDGERVFGIESAGMFFVLGAL
ncbi:MAG: DUF1285 domain-containing protein [Pseudomonadales bacterium]|nr:DUF1285 domain-containing protein [Pseudomonadales bacterium]